MIKEIILEVESAIDQAFEQMCSKDNLSFVLFIGRADVIHELQPYLGTECVIDYQLDRYFDETREEFYLRYLNRNYSREWFHYEGVKGIDDLSIEMMIYDHLWDSTYFLKSLIRLASILTGKGYLWNPEVPERGKWKFIHEEIAMPLKVRNFKIGEIVEKAYSSDIRNSFAHSLYKINAGNKSIILRPKRGERIISFEEFQYKFLYSVILMNKMQNAIELNHEVACCINGCLTRPFMTPDKVEVQVFGKLININGKAYPKYELVKIKR